MRTDVGIFVGIIAAVLLGTIIVLGLRSSKLTLIQEQQAIKTCVDGGGTLSLVYNANSGDFDLTGCTVAPTVRLQQ